MASNLTSNELNLLVYRYLMESGKIHSWHMRVCVTCPTRVWSM